MPDANGSSSEDTVADLAEAQLNVFQGLNDLHKRTLQSCVSIAEQAQADGSVKSLTVPVHKRRQLWEKVLVKLYTNLAKVAVQYFLCNCS
jgi:hypothetical protein